MQAARLRFRLFLLASLLTSCQPRLIPTSSFTEKTFETSLAVVSIETSSVIVDESKVMATMQVRTNHLPNRLDDPPNAYDGYIGIEIRGQTSQAFAKKQYGFETRDITGGNRNISLLGLPEENDWIWQGPYSDKTLMRNVLAYDLARSMGRYASRTAYAELFINGDYQGVYVLLEKLKRDKNRVDISKLESDVSGGYLLELTRGLKLDAGDTYFSLPVTKRPVILNDPAELRPEAKDYITAHVSAFETALYSEAFRDPEWGYRRYLDIDSAIDYMLIQELFKNADAFNASSFFYKDKGEKLAFGPVWDFNYSSGNDFDEARLSPEGWLLPNRMWSERLLQDPYFVERYVSRWQTLEAGGVFEAVIANIDVQAEVLAEAQWRNYQRWPVLGRIIGWNPPAETVASYEGEVERLRGWMTARVQWLSENFSSLLDQSSVRDY